MTIEELFAARCADPLSDIAAHLPELRRLGERCAAVVEFGVRDGCSTAAFLASGCRMVYSYDMNPPGFDCPEDARARWMFFQCPTENILTIPDCDLFMIDTRHTAAQLRAELRFAVASRRWIVLHDHIRWGSVGEDGGPGLIEAIFDFLIACPQWRPACASSESMGLLVLERT